MNHFDLIVLCIIICSTVYVRLMNHRLQNDYLPFVSYVLFVSLLCHNFYLLVSGIVYELLFSSLINSVLLLCARKGT